MLEKKIKWTTRLMILGAFGQGLVSFCLVVIFTLTTAMTRTNKSTYKYTEGLAYALVCGIASLSVAILATYQQHLNRTQVYIHIMYELSPSQRQLILLTIASLTYLILLGSIYALLEKWDFNDALYWCLVTLTTIGFGDITPQTTVGKALLPLVSSAGILLIGFQIYAIRQVALELITLQLASQFSKSFGIDQELVGLSSATSDPSRSGNGAWSSLENGVHGSGYDSLGRRGRGRVRKRAYSLTDGFGYGALVHSPRLSSPSPSPALSPMPYLSDHYGRDQGPSDFDALDLAAPAITTPKMTPHDPTYQGDQQNVPQHLRSPEQHHHQHQRQHHQHHQSHDVHLGSTHPAPRRTKTTSHLLQNVDTGTNGGGHHFRRTYTAPLAETPSTPPFSPQAPRTMTISRSAALPQLTIVAGADVRRSQVVEVAIATFKQQITYGVVAVAANFVFFGGLFAYFEKWNFFEGVYFSYIALTTIGR
ncbi:Potassium channel [Quaeritorhiza haematococci]|nr:Potassium channel [Quaeritorhiza haematococci]